MKRWYRKVNRGLVLAGILLLGLISCHIVAAIRFNQQKESAKQLIENYMEEVTAFAVDETASNAQVEQLINTYWEQKEMRSQDSGLDKEMFQMQMQQFLEEKNGNLEQLSGIMTNYEISRYGRDGALCKIKYRYDVTVSGETMLILPTGIEVITEEIWSEYGLQTSQKIKRTEQLYTNFYLKVTKDGWKIVQITVNGYTEDGVTPIETREE